MLVNKVVVMFDFAANVFQEHEEGVHGTPQELPCWWTRNCICFLDLKDQDQTSSQPIPCESSGPFIRNKATQKVNSAEE